MKKDLMELEVLIRALAEFWDDKRLLTMSVLIQNAAFKANDWEWSEFAPVENILKMNAKYRPDCHVSQWMLSEFSMIVDGHFMSQQY